MDLPAEPQLRWLLRHTATLLALGAEPVRGLVQPNADFFPDRFDGGAPAVAALTTRIQAHAGLADLDVELAVVAPNGEAKKVSCASGACGVGPKLDAKVPRVSQRGEGAYTVALAAGEVGNPLILTTALVRSVATMFLCELDAYRGVPDQDREPLTDLAGVMLGFGVLLANGSYIYAKGCGGVSVQSATTMPVDEITVGLGIFCRLFGVSERAAKRHLELTPAEHFDEAYAWASSNSAVVKMLRTSPKSVHADEYALLPSRSWLARALGIGGAKRAREPDDELAELERAMRAQAPKKVDAAKAKKLAELRALVDETLESS